MPIPRCKWKIQCAGDKKIMLKKTQQKANDLAKELKREIQAMEAELDHKKQLLSSLAMFDIKPGFKARRKPGPKKAAAVKVARRGRRAMPTRRKSKNRDAILAAASKLGDKFSLAELISEIHKKNPKFGGKFPSGTVLATLRNTPEVKKIKRGTYAYKG